MSQVNWNRQLSLSIALCALGGLAYWLEAKHRPDLESAQEQSKQIFQIKDKTVQSIRLIDGTRTENPTLTLLCSDSAAKLCKPGDLSQWEISDPAKVKADSTNTNALLSTLSSLSSTEVIDLKDESPEKRTALLKEYGLDAEARANSKRVKQVQVNTESGKAVLYLGNLHPIGESFFALRETPSSENKSEGKSDAKSPEKTQGKIDETHVYLIPSFFKSNFEHDLTYWRNKKLVTVGAHEVESFKLTGSKTGPAGAILGERKASQWMVQQKDTKLSGDTETIDSLMSTTTALVAKKFASDSKNSPQAKKLLQGVSPALTLTLQKEKGSEKTTPDPITLQFYRKKLAANSTSKTPKAAEPAYATVSNLDPLFEIDASSVDNLDKSIKDLRVSKMMTSMERFAAKRLEFKGAQLGNAPLVLALTDGKWANSDKTPVDQSKVQGILGRLSGNRIKDFLEGSKIPAGEAEGLQLTIGDDQSETKKQILFWKKEGQVYAKDLQSKRNEAFHLDPLILNALPWDKDFLRAAAPPSPVPAGVKPIAAPAPKPSSVFKKAQ